MLHTATDFVFRADGGVSLTVRCQRGYANRIQLAHVAIPKRQGGVMAPCQRKKQCSVQ